MFLLAFGSVVVGLFGLWLMRTRFGWGCSLVAILFAFWAYGGMTEYSVRREYCKQMGADITIVGGRQLWCTNGVQPPSVDWERDWGYLLGF